MPPMFCISFLFPAYPAGGLFLGFPSQGHSPAVGGFAAYGWGVPLAGKTALEAVLDSES